METEAQKLLVGEVARRAGVKITTIRFYEQQGLLPAPQRRASGYREYPTGVVAQIRFIQHAQDLGFTLSEVRDLLALQNAPEHGCDAVHDAAESKLALIREKIRSLKHMESVLSRLVASCRAGSPLSECPIIEALNQ